MEGICIWTWSRVDADGETESHKPDHGVCLGGTMEKLDIALCEASSRLPNRERIVTRFDQALHLVLERRLE